MPSIVCPGATRAGTELHFGQQRFERLPHIRITTYLVAQRNFSGIGSERRRRSRANGDMDVFDALVAPLQPDCYVDDRQRHTLRTHDALERRCALGAASHADVEADEDFLAMLQR